MRFGKNSTLSNLLTKRGPSSAVNASLTGMAAVSNFGDNVNWTGSILGANKIQWRSCRWTCALRDSNSDTLWIYRHAKLHHMSSDVSPSSQCQLSLLTTTLQVNRTRLDLDDWPGNPARAARRFILNGRRKRSEVLGCQPLSL